MEGDVARAGAGAVVGEERGRTEARSRRVQREDRKLVRAEIVDDDEAVVGREVRGVRMRRILTRGDGAALAELRVPVVDALDRLG